GAGELVAMVAYVALAVELDVHPVSRMARMSFDLWGETLSVDRDAVWERCARELGERGEEVAEVGQVVAHLARGGRAGPVDDERNAASPFEHRALVPRDGAAVDGRLVRQAIGPVVAGEDDHRVLAQTQMIEVLNQSAHELVHVFDVRGIDRQRAVR